MTKAKGKKGTAGTTLVLAKVTKENRKAQANAVFVAIMDAAAKAKAKKAKEEGKEN
ncbi:MAG: hypothetical protein KDE23_20215 [Caldilinea sp.]|nr:hypothetical protein [Caldilinea sp.]